jgi:hypothetical protein
MASPVKETRHLGVIEMESFESDYKPSEAEKSNAFHLTTLDTESSLQVLDAAFCFLRRRKDALYLELKKPGLASDKERLRGLLTEWERIARALRGQSAAGVAL